jgi:hypothetical protein
MKQEGYKHLVGNTGYILLKIPQDVLGEIKTSVDEIQNDFSKATPYNDQLAGQIDKEYQTKLGNKATQYIKYAVDEYNKAEPEYYMRKQDVLGKTSKMEYNGGAWVNFQEKYEYNPIHSHSGVFSYVIWYQIPFYREDEIKYGAGKYKNKDNYNVNGEFAFVFHNGESITNHVLGVDKRMEGYMAVFPSSLIHQVYPFYTSDDYRITISGNIFLKGL